VASRSTAANTSDGTGAFKRSAKINNLILDNLIDLKADGSFRLDMSYFDFLHRQPRYCAKMWQLDSDSPYMLIIADICSGKRAAS
jgi:hypothetical protein